MHSYVYYKEIRVNLAFLRGLRALAALAIALASALPASAAPVQTPIGSIVGTVVDKGSGVPLPGVSVRVVGTDRRTQTDASGHFVFGGTSRRKLRSGAKSKATTSRPSRSRSNSAA